MKIVGNAVLLAGTIEVLVIPFVQDLCSGDAGCAANSLGVSLLHWIAGSIVVAGLATYACKWQKKR